MKLGFLPQTTKLSVSEIKAIIVDLNSLCSYVKLSDNLMVNFNGLLIAPRV